MTPKIEDQYRLSAPNAFNLMRIIPSEFLSPTGASLEWPYWAIPEENTAASWPRSLVRAFRPYTEKELEMLAEADAYTPELREQVRAFLQE